MKVINVPQKCKYLTFVNENIVCWLDCCSAAVVLLLFPFISFVKLNFDMFTYLFPATKSKPLWNEGDFGIFTFNLCSIGSSSGDNWDDNFIAFPDTKTILQTTLPIQIPILLTLSFGRKPFHFQFYYFFFFNIQNFDFSFFASISMLTYFFIFSFIHFLFFSFIKFHITYFSTFLSLIFYIHINLPNHMREIWGYVEVRFTTTDDVKHEKNI